MLCDICHKKEATVHLTEIINDKITKMHLCEQCASEKSQTMEAHFDLSDLLAGLADIGDIQQPTIKKGIKCPSCGFALGDFQRIGRLGCPKCYETFRNQLAPLLRRIHGQDRHMGKLTVRTVSGKLSKDARELHALKVGLQKAISTEAFEEAAKLRDKIKEIEEKFKRKRKK